MPRCHARWGYVPTLGSCWIALLLLLGAPAFTHSTLFGSQETPATNTPATSTLAASSSNPEDPNSPVEAAERPIADAPLTVSAETVASDSQVDSTPVLASTLAGIQNSDSLIAPETDAGSRQLEQSDPSEGSIENVGSEKDPPASGLPEDLAPEDAANSSPENASGNSTASESNDSEAAATVVSPATTRTALQPPAGQQVANGNLVGTEAWLNDVPTNVLLGVVLVTLAIASLVGQYLRRQPSEAVNPALVRRFRQRLNAWWLMCAILVFGLLLQPIGTVVLFGFVSFWALREFITMAPTRRGDHRALFWALIVFTPLQYVLIGLERSGVSWRRGAPVDFYGLYSIMIPVYASLFVPARIAMSGDHKRFLERSAQITSGLLICVYSLSYAPALINLRLATSSGVAWTGSAAGLLFFFVLLSQLSDILQWTWGQIVGKRMIAGDVSTSRTWEGFVGGTLSLGVIGAALFWVTPFTIWEAACMSMVIGVMGMFGGMTMSAIKRDRGVNDYGSLVLGHAGVLDRIDTLCFAAPVFYHLTRFFFTI